MKDFRFPETVKDGILIYKDGTGETGLATTGDNEEILMMVIVAAVKAYTNTLVLGLVNTMADMMGMGQDPRDGEAERPSGIVTP